MRRPCRERLVVRFAYACGTSFPSCIRKGNAVLKRCLVGGGRRFGVVGFSVVIAWTSLSCVQPRGFDPADYPVSRRVETVEVLHGLEIPDPYRWLEDQESPETRDWIDRQNSKRHYLSMKMDCSILMIFWILWK